MAVNLHMRHGLNSYPHQSKRLTTRFRADLDAGEGGMGNQGWEMIPHGFFRTVLDLVSISEAGMDFKILKCCDEAPDSHLTRMPKLLPIPWCEYPKFIKLSFTNSTKNAVIFPNINTLVFIKTKIARSRFAKFCF